MIASTKGIVLRNTKYSDNKNILTLLTEDFGKMPYIVYAPHSKRAVLRGSALQVLSVLDLQVEHREGRNLQKIKDARVYKANKAILDNPPKAAFSFFMAEVVDKSIYAPEKDKEVFDFLYSSIENLEASDKVGAYLPMDFMMDLSRHLGFYPYDGGDNEFLRAFAGDARLDRFVKYLQGERDFDRSGRRDILHLAVDYFRLNLPLLRGLSTVEVLESFFSEQ